MRIEVTHDITKLERNVYIFWINTDSNRINIHLDVFRHETKESTRKKKWNALEIYSRLGDTRLSLGEILSRDDIIVPGWIKIKVIDRINDSMEFN